MNIATDNNAHAYMPPLSWISWPADGYDPAVNVKEAS